MVPDETQQQNKQEDNFSGQQDDQLHDMISSKHMHRSEKHIYNQRDAMYIQDSNSIKLTNLNENQQFSSNLQQAAEMHNSLYGKTPDGKFPSELLASFPTPKQLDSKNQRDGLIVEIKQIEKMIKKQEEQHKQQLIHVETVGIMTKYQLVFIKLETMLTKIANMIKKREWLHKLNAFKDIQQHSYIKKQNNQLKSKLIFRILEKKVGSIQFALQKIINKQLNQSFKKIIFVNNLKEYEQKIKLEHEKFKKEFVVTLNKKDQELSNINKKNEESNQLVFQLKNKEIELITKIKGKDQQIQMLQRQLASLNALPNPNPQANTKKDPQQLVTYKLLEQKVREAEQENIELKEKLSQAENSVAGFMREMGDMLDSHEMSTNIVSDDNVSLNNSHSNNQFQGEM
ncbi:hypothetical protein ABPG74_020963 [Tetrahymena malaccensis]